ncbi:MAG: phosphoribosylglycinamide formyltransferase [Flavobacteriaceae bacterium]
MQKKIILFASGNGSNVEEICRFFQQDPNILVAGVYTNNPHAGVIQRLKPFGLEARIFNMSEFSNGGLLKEISDLEPDLLVLAGFLWKIGGDWVAKFPKKIINIHPALLPKYGGKGMYGNHVHQAVKANREKESGITIHFVNEAYDEGAIIIQKKTPLLESDTESQIAEKVHQLEHSYFPITIAELLKSEGA